MHEFPATYPESQIIWQSFPTSLRRSLWNFRCSSKRRLSEKFLYPLLIPQIEKTSARTKDYKSLLQQFIQKESGEFVEYALEKEEGPDHSKTFYMTVKYQNNIVGRGAGKSKRAAEQAAAHDALVLFGELTDES